MSVWKIDMCSIGIVASTSLLLVVFAILFVEAGRACPQWQLGSATYEQPHSDRWMAILYSGKVL
jgi:hypothetical protein